MAGGLSRYQVADRQLQRVLAELGELTDQVGPSAQGDGDGAVSFAEYVGRPAAFAREVLGLKLLRWHEDWLGAWDSFRQAAIRSGNGVGKTILMGILLLYVAAVLGGVGVYLSASAKQTRSQLVEQLKRLILKAPAISADVYNFGAVFPASGGVLHFLNAGDFSVLQGFHGQTLTIVADEAQALETDQLAALQGCAVGENNWLILSGNPLVLGGPFFKVCTGGDPSWHRTKITAFDVINDPVAAAIPGLVTKAGVDRLRQTWGEESSVFQSRVWGEFPSRPTDALFPAEAIEAAFARWRDPDFKVREERRKLVVGLDVGASEFGDESVLAVARGGYVRELITWREADTMRTVGIATEVLRRLMVARHPLGRKVEARLRMGSALGHALANTMAGDPLAYGGVPATVRVDEVGVGRGVSDRLAELGYAVHPFNSSRRPDEDDDAVKYANQRAQAYARLRTLLVQGKVALPPDPLLEAELLTAQASLNAAGKLQIFSKDEWRTLLGRSPDRLDAVIMAVAAPVGALDGLAAVPCNWAPIT